MSDNKALELQGQLSYAITTPPAGVCMIAKSDAQAILAELRRLAAVEAELERIRALEPVAYCRFAENGNIRLWARTHAEAIASTLPEGPPMTPLYAIPPEHLT